MLIFLPKFFDKRTCTTLSNTLLRAYNTGKLSKETDNKYGSTLPEFEAILRQITPTIKQKTGYNNISIQNSFSRIYFNNSILPRHVDRHGLDITVTACIYDDTNVKWPLYVETENGIKEVITEVGDAGIILGTKMNHWRDRLICENRKMVMQCFFHWSIDK